MSDWTKSRNRFAGFIRIFFGAVFLIGSAILIIAVLGQDVALKKRLAMIVLGLLFSGAGILLIVIGGANMRTPAAVNEPIGSSEKNSYWLLAFMAFAAICVSWPMLMRFEQEMAQANWLFLFVLIFPVISVWCAIIAWRDWRNWRFYGPAPLSLDPAPAQVGGHFGGYISLNHHVGGNEWTVTLECLEVRISGGENNSRYETILWQASRVPELRSNAEGYGVYFCFEPPDDLPESSNGRYQRIEWRLMLSGPAKPVALKRTYNMLPVEHGSNRSSSSPNPRHSERQEKAATLHWKNQVARQIDLKTLGNGLQLHSRTGRHLLNKAVVLVFGVGFAGGGVGLWSKAADDGVIMYVLAAAFVLAGSVSLIIAVCTLGRSLRATISGDEVTSVRYWLGFPIWQRRGRLTRADQIGILETSHSSSGSRPIRYHCIYVKSDEQLIRLAEEIVDRSSAEALQAYLSKLLFNSGERL